METEQLIYTIYKITNSVDDMVYIGSTRQKIYHRLNGYKTDIKKGCGKPITQHMIKHGFECFKLEEIKKVVVSSRLEARIIEQEEINKIPPELRLNVLRAYSENREKTRDQDKKRATRRVFYNKHKEDPEWMAKERERNRIRMAKKRVELKANK